MLPQPGQKPHHGSARPARGLMRHAAMLIALAMLAGCVTASARSPYTIDEMTAASVIGHDDLRFFPRRRPDVVNALGWRDPEAMPNVAEADGGDGRFDILALSSGGPDGAFGAGAVKAMVETGTFPRYEVVTGISTGALLAPFVFTGPGNEALLEKFYTSASFDKLLGAPNVFTALGGASLYPGTQIPTFMKRHVDARLIARVAAEHAKGRRLLIATANLDTSELVVWDMGRIASLGTSQGNDLFRAILRAAIAIPGALPPVEITATYGGNTFREFHGDAGVLAYFYGDEELVPDTWRTPAGGKRKKKKGARPRLDVILHNQIEPRPRPLEARAIKLVGASASNLTRTSMRLLLDNTIRSTADANVEMRYAFIPQDWSTVSSLEFDAEYMRATFDLGHRLVVEDKFWHSGPRDGG